jgi:hypothetical protein
VCGAGREIEVPDTAVEVLIEPVARGRYDSETLAPGRIWSKEFGLLDVEDHLKKVEIKKEEGALKTRQEADRLRRQEEAERKAAEAKKAKDAEPKEKIDVARAASGLVKVMKPKK